MFEINDVVVYRKEVFRIIDKRKNTMNKEESFVLVPYIKNDGLATLLQVPVANSMGYLRHISTKKEIKDLIQQIPSILLIEGDSRSLESEYKIKMKRGTLEDLVSVMKTASLRKKERMLINKKSGVVDDNYLQLAERYLLEELSVVMDLKVEDAKAYLIDEVARTR